MKSKKVLAAFLFGTLGVGTLVLVGCSQKGEEHQGHGSHAGSEAVEKEMVYACPMHPEVTSDKPGQKCDKCGMNLVSVARTNEQSGDRPMDVHSGHEGHVKMPMSKSSEPKTEAKPLYHCPMHPTYTSDRPGECAICGMNLVPVRMDETRESSVTGQAVVKIPEKRQQLIGVKMGEVKKRSFVKDIRTVARVAYDPELYRAQEEYMGALSAYERVRNSSLPESVERSKSLLESSRLRLRLLGLSDGQIDRLSRRDGPDTSLLLSKTGAGTVWLYAEVYESELSLVKVGQTIEARVLAYPDVVFTGRIKAIDSVIDPKTRSARARAEIANIDGILKPDMYLNAWIKVDLGERLTVPESAVMDSGTRRLVFVAEGDGFFEPREVSLGAKSENYYHVKSGLVEGEKVVTSGNFLIDSESKLKASLSALAGGHQH